ncbi:hypothetical protein IAD21_02114 [Abditibacteriota bacterium]|nr:hypothetical protein IAD21_02114 [Abditibacteriota bacterium]
MAYHVMCDSFRHRLPVTLFEKEPKERERRHPEPAKDLHLRLFVCDKYPVQGRGLGQAQDDEPGSPTDSSMSHNSEKESFIA